MKISELPLNTPVLCKHINVKYSEIFEIEKRTHSKNMKAVYLKITIYSIAGGSYFAWKDVEDLDKKWEIFDTL